MGCDGGTIPKRDELVKTKKKPEQKDKKSERAFRWKHCAISQQPVQPPVVSCELGRIYSKEAVLETLLNKAEGVPAIAAHIRTLKDVKELNLTDNPAWDSTSSSNAEVGDAYIDSQKSQWICPVSGQEMNGTFKFSFIWTCGCVLSEKALKELKKGNNADMSECLKCQKPFTFEDVIIINPTEEEEIERQAERMAVRRSLAKKNKKGSKKREAEVESSDSTSKATNGSTDKVKTEAVSSSSPSASTSSSEPGSSRSNGDSGIPPKKSKFSVESKAKGASTGKKDSDPANKIKGYSVSKDPNASEAYKSLFTSHETAQNQTKAHWITYNPFYN